MYLIALCVALWLHYYLLVTEIVVLLQTNLNYVEHVIELAGFLPPDWRVCAVLQFRQRIVHGFNHHHAVSTYARKLHLKILRITFDDHFRLLC